MAAIHRNCWSGVGRMMMFLMGVTLCHGLCLRIFWAALADANSGKMDAQRPTPRLCCYPAVLVFYPLLLHSMISLTLVLWDRLRFGKFVAVRFGLYTGVILALQFHVIVFFPDALRLLDSLILVGLAAVGIAVSGFGFVIATFVLNSALFAKNGSTDSPPSRGTIAARIVLVVILIAMVTGGAESCRRAHAIGNLLVHGHLFLHICIGLVRKPQQAVWLGVVLGHGFLGRSVLAALRNSIQLAILEYQKLPTEPPPTCYVCTAAANGHRRFVGRFADSSVSFPVNRQLQRIKCGEFAVRAISPTVHRKLRLIYDRIGPPAARLLRHPLAADAAYLSLKPIEFAVLLVLTLLRISPLLVHRLYRTDSR
ncbi:MAG: DUF6688 family protein [Pirellulaceae bacterium]